MSDRLGTLEALLVDALAEVERLRVEVVGSGLPLGDRAALLLLAYPDGVGCEPLARRLAVRTAALRDVLRDDPRFAREGGGRFARWHVGAARGQDGIADGWHGPATPDPDWSPTSTAAGPENAEGREAA